MNILYFCKLEMRYCSEHAPRTGEWNVNLNKNTSENAALNKMFHPDERAPSFIFKQLFYYVLSSGEKSSGNAKFLLKWKVGGKR